VCDTTPRGRGEPGGSEKRECAKGVIDHISPLLHRYRVSPPSSVVKCAWEVFDWRVGVLFLSYACVSASGVLFSVGVCVCDL